VSIIILVMVHMAMIYEYDFLLFRLVRNFSKWLATTISLLSGLEKFIPRKGVTMWTSHVYMTWSGKKKNCQWGAHKHTKKEEKERRNIHIRGIGWMQNLSSNAIIHKTILNTMLTLVWVSTSKGKRYTIVIGMLSSLLYP